MTTQRPDFVFFDVEALGPPGHGQIFALGAVRFDPWAGTILERWSRDVAVGDSFGFEVRATAKTLQWLLRQRPEVIAQLQDPEADGFSRSYLDFTAFVLGPWADGRRIFLCADDWSDFAWIEFEAGRARLDSLRGSVGMYDTSILDHLKPARVIEPTRPLIQHIAVDDAEAGAIRLMERWPYLAMAFGEDV